MMSINWENFFSKTILKRGREYFRQGLVNELDYDERGISAVVSGSYDYDVQIVFNGRRIEYLSCDCPYAEEENNCKHMAAVLYAWEKDLKAPFHPEKKKEPVITLEEAVQSLSEEQAKDLLLEYAKKEEHLRNRILIMATGQVDRRQRKAWERELNLLNQAFEDSYGYDWDYDCDETYEHFQDLIGFLQRTADLLINAKCFDDAFELICEVYDSIDSDCDDYSGGHEELVNECEDYLQRIVWNSKDNVQEKIYRECLERCGGNISYQNDDLWQSVLLTCFEDEKHLRQNLQMIENAIKNAQIAGESEWLLKLIQDKIALMKRLKVDQTEISDFRNEYRQHPTIRRMEMMETMERNDIPSAIQLLRESKRMDTDQPLLVKEYSQKLIQLYEAQNETNACCSELVEYIFERSNYELEYIRKLKRISSNEMWRSYLERLLNLELYPHIRHELMAEEGMYRELLDELETDPYLSGLQRYEMLLKPYFEEEIRDVFCAYLRARMETATGRGSYEELIKRLKKMKMYADGEEMAQKLAEEWKQNYKRRSALLDELKKAGY